jgi:hypothetical protein
MWMARRRQLGLDLKSFITPSTSSKLIECEYWVDVECDIPWCPDVEIHMPVVVFAPQMTVTVCVGIGT